MKQNNEVNNEIDLKDLFLTLWHGKFYIILLSVGSVFFASFYLQTAERKYSVEYNLKPVGETKNNQGLSSFNRLASFSGIQLPTRSNNDFNIFKELLTSTEVSEIIFENEKITKDIFRNEWNESLNDYSNLPVNKIQVLIGNIKSLLTGNKEANYIPPNPKRLAIYISKNIQIIEDEKTGLLSIKSETSKPELILSIIIKATEAGDKIMRQNYIDFSVEPLAFYKQKIRTARSREHREALAELISREEQKLMFASRGKYFIAEPYINPSISLYPTSPNPKIILGLSLLLGFIIGVAFILLRHSIMKDKL
jgi:LPS O-antigen subunit length determinant protein (WzzB/FepE family)